jgi:hypothetical protein
VSAVGMGFLSIASSLLNIVLDDWKSLRTMWRSSPAEIATLGFAISLMTPARVTLADCFLGSPFPHKNHDFRNPGSFLVNLDQMALCLKSRWSETKLDGYCSEPSLAFNRIKVAAPHAPGIWM